MAPADLRALLAAAREQGAELEIVLRVRCTPTELAEATGPEDHAAGALQPPHPDGWTSDALAERYACSPSTMRARIAAGEFGEPGADGGPRKRGRGWMVPHHQVLARDRRVQGAPTEELPAAPAPLSCPARPAKGGRTLSLAEARRQRVAGQGR